jgi:feruloyl esterase
MKLTSLLFLSSAVGTAHVLPRTQEKCTSFAHNFALQGFNASFLNATYYPVRGLNVSGTFNSLPFCEVYSSISYGDHGNDSLIFAVWLPDAPQYQQRFLAVGNGGMAGELDYVAMVTQLNSGVGFSIAGGNAGHMASTNNNGSGAPNTYIPYLHDPAQVKAWIHDAISLFTPAAKALAAAYYGQAVKYSYYSGCSTGGAQGFALAQFHPEMFDAIYAGSPGNWYSHLALSFLWNAQHTDVSLLHQLFHGSDCC